MGINWQDESGNQLAGRELRLTGKDTYDDQSAGEESRSSGWVSMTTVKLGRSGGNFAGLKWDDFVTESKPSKVSIVRQ